jgi:outer membrane protein assembly factor BamB
VLAELPLAREVDYFRVARDRYFVPITVKLPAGAVGFTKKGSKQQANIDFIGQVRDEKGKLVSGIRDELVVKVRELDLDKIAKHNIQYDGGLTLAPGKYNLRFLARENASGKMGTFETSFVVPDLAGGKNLRVSSVILGSQREAVSSAVGAADSNKKLQAGHPLVSDGQKLLPSITRVFRKDQTLYVYFEVYDPTLDTGKVAWGVKTPQPLIGGTLATAGNLVFNGEANGWFKAYHAKDGKELWKYYLGAGVNAPPVAYTVGNTEYIAVAAGGNNQIDSKRGNSVFVFKLIGGEKIVPR